MNRRTRIFQKKWEQRTLSRAQNHKDKIAKEGRKAHTWYFDDDAFIRDVAYTIDGGIDRSRIPGRAFTTQGNLALMKNI